MSICLGQETPKKVVLTCPNQEANETGPLLSFFSLPSGHRLGWSVQMDEKEGRKEEEQKEGAGREEEEGGAASQHVGRRG